MTIKSLDDKKHDARMIVLAFALTSLAGGVFTFGLDYLAENRALNERRRDDASKVFDEATRGMEKRLFLWRQVASAIQDTSVPPARRLQNEERRLDEYRVAFIDWNTSLNRNRALLCRFFGSGAREEFDAIQAQFIILEDSLKKRRRLKRNVPSRSDTTLYHLADNPLNPAIYRFASTWADVLRIGKFEQGNRGDSCS